MGRVSPQTRTPRWRAARTASTAALARHVDDVDLGVDQFRVVDDPSRGLGLGERGAALGVEPRVEAPGGDHVLLGQVEHLAVLAVDVDDRARPARRPEHAEQRLVSDAELADGEDLEARVARADDGGDLGDPRVGRVGQDDVEAVVDVGAAAGLGRPRGDRVGEALALRLPRVVADGGDAAAAAAAVPDSKSSAVRVPPRSRSRWVWTSTPPGSTWRPRASISRAPGGSSRPMLAMRPLSTPRSATKASVAVATRPPRITRSSAMGPPPPAQGAQGRARRSAARWRRWSRARRPGGPATCARARRRQRSRKGWPTRKAWSAMPKTRGWSRDCSSISSNVSTIISAKAGAVPWWMAIIGMSFTSCG